MPNNYGLFFSRGGLVVRLPVNPEKLPETRDNNNTEYNVLGIGQIMVPRTPKLKTVQISSWFPGRVSSLVLNTNGFQPAEYYINFFRSAMTDKVPIRYTPVRYYENGEPYFSTDTGMDVLVTQFDTEERAGETGDFYYTLTLTEYRDYSPQTMQVKQTGNTTQATTQAARSIPATQLYVGCTVKASGTYCASSYGDKPSRTVSGITAKVSRIVDGSRAYPVHITTTGGSPLGWMKKSALQVVKT